MSPLTFRNSERGTVTVLTVGVFLILTLFVGMSTDFGIFLRYRRAMQNACDSGALAGGPGGLAYLVGFTWMLPPPSRAAAS